MEWSKIKVNQEIELVKPPIEKVQLVKYAGASGDFNLIHTDDETARKSGLPGVIAHGMISMGFLGQLVSNFVGNEGFVSRLQVRFVGMVRPGDTVTCKGIVVAKDEEKRTVDLQITTEKEPGRASTIGQATIKFFSPVGQS
jgi:acyl dehydratase